jgi:hypothetical protein
MVQEGRIAFPDSIDSPSFVGGDADPLDSIHNNVKGLEGSVDSLKGDCAHVKDGFKCFDWRFWRWPRITVNILKIGGSMSNTIFGMVGSVAKLKGDVDHFNSVDYDSVDVYGFDEDAKSIAKKLGKKMNTTFTVKTVNANDVKKGDIVQYVSQGRYPRYLEVIDIISNNNTNVSGRQLLGFSSFDVPPLLVLKGVGDKEIKTFYKNYFELVPQGTANAEGTLQNVVDIQQKDIKKIKNKAAQVQKKVDILTIDSISIIALGLILLAAGGACTVLGSITAPIPPLSFALIFSGNILFILGGTFSILGGGFLLKKDVFAGKAKKLKNFANSNENDLNNYLVTEPKNEVVLDVSTFNGIPIIKQPPISNWRDFTFVCVKKPQHGDLLPGPGLQFLYGPNDGYTGKDTFKYQYTDKYGIIKGHVTVNIDIKSIPVFNINPSGSVAL